MSEADSYWEIALSSDRLSSTKDAEAFLKERAEGLGKLTEGRVEALFAPAGEVGDGSRAVGGEAMAAAATTVAASIGGLGLVGRTPPLRDANDWYEQRWYAFEIRGGCYRFRMFELELPATYPLALDVDEGVLDDVREDLRRKGISVKKGEGVIIKNLGELETAFETLMGSAKLKTILKNLLMQ